ncbi:hypothetical protein LTR66_002453, partial [Elasticomyces elasticus]
RGSYVFPQAAFISGAGFIYLAYGALPLRERAVMQLLSIRTNGGKVNGYLAAAALTIGIAPFAAVMLPTNSVLISMNEEKGSARSEKNAREVGEQFHAGGRSALDSVNSKGEAAKFTDLTGPQA